MGAREGDPGSLATAKPPPLAPDDHVRRGERSGRGASDVPLLVVYFDLACPACATIWRRIRSQPLEICVRHFPLSGKRPRSPFLHAATEAVAMQDEAAFWTFWDDLVDDRGHTDDPHLWERVSSLGLDLDRFERDRRSGEVAERVRRDFRDGIRAGVTATPGVFFEDVLLGEPLEIELERIASG